MSASTPLPSSGTTVAPPGSPGSSSGSPASAPGSPAAARAPHTLSRRPWRGRFVILAGVILVALNVRIAVAAFSPIAFLVQKDVPFSTGAQGILGDIAPLAFALFGSLAPRWSRRFSLEAVTIGAMAMLILGEAGRSASHSSGEFIAWSVLIMGGSGIGNVTVPPLIKKYFPDRVGPVLSIYSFCTTFSVALPPLFILTMAEATGWRTALGAWIALAVIAIVPWVLTLFSPRRAGSRFAAVRRRLKIRGGRSEAHKLSLNVGKQPLTWAFVAIFFVNAFLSYAMYSWLPDILTTAGETKSEAALYLGLFGAGTLAFVLFIPPLTVRMKRPELLSFIFFAGFTIGFIGLAVSPGHLTWLWIMSTRVGDCFYAYAVTLVLIRTRTEFGASAVQGFAQSMAYLLGATGPLAFGYLHDLTHTWTVPLWLVVAVLPLQLIGGYAAARAKPMPV